MARIENEHRCGWVALMGPPNAGKSTLLNACMGTKVAITSPVAQTTRRRMRAVVDRDEFQLVFVDTPGIHKPKDGLGSELNRSALAELSDVDVVAFLIDASVHIGRGDAWVAERVAASSAVKVLVLTKADKVDQAKMIKQIEEARKLVAGGVRELMVIAQDTTFYGVDLYGRRRLAELLEALCRIEGLEWLRLHYAYPTGFPEEVIEVMAREPKICKYLDIPFQHISDRQLTAMKRHHTKAEAYELIARLRARIPDIALRTTLLVGYPGETEEDFEELLQFVRDVRFERLGVFAYSEEEGTYSALELRDDVPDEVKQERVERIMTLQREISLENNLRRVGRTGRVIIDSRQGDYYVGRSQYDSPEVDQEILIPAAGRRMLRGHFYPVRIVSAAEYDLYGERVEG